jgi:hypothetical protein
VTSDQEDEDETMRADPRLDLMEHRGDPRDDFRAADEAEDRGTGSPTGPLSLTTNDKDNGGASPKSISPTEVSYVKLLCLIPSEHLLWGRCLHCVQGLE